MGMNGRQVLRSIELPLASPLIIAGIRTSAVQVVATATLAAVISYGGLGRYIVDGFALGQSPEARAQVLGGAILVALLAIVTELVFGIAERFLAPRTHSKRTRTLPAFKEVGQVPRPSEGPPL
jgi:osmoprotectant transport system permease protein